MPVWAFGGVKAAHDGADAGNAAVDPKQQKCAEADQGSAEQGGNGSEIFQNAYSLV